MTPSFLDAYLARIGYAGPRTPTVAALHSIAQAHVQAIPFENLDVLWGRRIALEPEALVEKLVHQRRGGYCFEQNGLLLHVLTALGFTVAPLGARVRIGQSRDYMPARTHMFLRVESEGDSWLVDVGVGGLSVTCALRLNAEGEQPTPHEPRRIVRESGRWFHQVWLAGQWSDVCEFALEEMPLIDRELANWFTSTHPKGGFKHRLVAARAQPDGARLNLLNRELTLRRRDGTAEKTTLSTEEAVRDALAQGFDLRFPQGTRFDVPAG